MSAVSNEVLHLRKSTNTTHVLLPQCKLLNPFSSIHLACISLAALIQYIDILNILKFIGKNGSMSQNLVGGYQKHGLI